MKPLSTTLSLLCISLIASCLSACAPLVVGVAAGSTAAVVTDERSLHVMYEDKEISREAMEAINSDTTLGNGTHINLTTMDHATLIVGQADTPARRLRVEKLVRSIPKVKHVYNRVDVRPPTDGIQRARDSWITAKTRAAMLTQESLKSGNIKVLTENGVVYLLGVMTRQQADLASDTARRVTDVKKVVQLAKIRA